MKFLSKKTDSEILKQGITYKKNSSINNSTLLELLLLEQMHFCAYTEKYLSRMDSPEVEHFNSAVKYVDDYYNYYAVARSSNLYKRKKEGEYNSQTNSFFTSLFFQNKQEFEKRIGYFDGIYYEIDPNDIEAKELIDYLGFNNPILVEVRDKYIKRIKEDFQAMGYNKKQYVEYFKRNPHELNFITAIENELGIEINI